VILIFLQKDLFSLPLLPTPFPAPLESSPFAHFLLFLAGVLLVAGAAGEAAAPVFLPPLEGEAAAAAAAGATARREGAAPFLLEAPLVAPLPFP